MDTTGSKRSTLEVIIDLNSVNSFNNNLLNIFKQIVANLLDIRPEQVQVTSVLPANSIRITIDVPVYSASQLLATFTKQPEAVRVALQPLRILDIRRGTDRATHQFYGRIEPGPTRELIRDLIVICYCRSENKNSDFCELLEVQLRGLQIAQQGRLRFRVELFDDERLAKPDGVDQLKEVLSCACVVVLLEEPAFMASNFVLDELILDYFETLDRHNAVTIFRVPIRSVVAIPRSFEDLSVA